VVQRILDDFVEGGLSLRASQSPYTYEWIGGDETGVPEGLVEAVALRRELLQGAIDLARHEGCLAIQLARDLDCHLVGAAPTGLSPLPAVPGLEPGASMADLSQRVWDAMVLGARQRVETFRAACRQTGLKSFEALVEGFNLTDRANVITRNTNFGAGAYPTNPSPSFNQITAVGEPRSFQFGARVRF
jgi:hypothetical protein